MVTEQSGSGTWRVFVQDLASALHVWRLRPLLPTVLAVWVMIVSLFESPFKSLFQTPEQISQILDRPGSRPVIALVVILAALFWSGWVGMERIWYLRAFRDKPMRVREAWQLMRAFYGRYFRLGLLVNGLMVGLIFGVFSVLLWFGLTRGLNYDRVFAQKLAFVWFPLVVLADMLLTFVTPALAYTTPSVRRALTIGWRMLRGEWPRSAGYVIVPPLAALVGVESLPPEAVGQVGKTALGVLAILLNLWFKGATAAFYLRRHQTGDDGAAYEAQDSAHQGCR